MRIEFNKISFIVGKSAEDNWNIISKANKDYYWIHAYNVPSSHIIIETDKPLEDEIKYACYLCIEHTKKLNNSTSFILTQIKNIKFGSKVGEVKFKNISNIVII
jgi:predicted ribosome quality control (RQC) complex YloA/Tae2 family protein